MFDWFFSPYSGLLAGIELFLRNSPGCSAVELLRGLTAVLLGAMGVRIAGHILADRRLRLRCPAYAPEEFSALHGLYREAGTLAGLTRLPPLHRYPNERPLAFTTGCFRPAVFLAPAVIQTLAADELRAVLVHELIHVRRRDNLRAWIGGLLPLAAAVVLVQAVALYVLFFRITLYFGFLQAALLAAAVAGLLWAFRSVAWPRVVFRRELSCDDLVVQAVNDPLVVAASLVQVWRLHRTLPRRWSARWAYTHALLPPRPSVQDRIRRLINYRPAPRRPWLSTARRLLSLAALLWTTLFLWAYHGPDLRAQLLEAVPEISLAPR